DRVAAQQVQGGVSETEVSLTAKGDGTRSFRGLISFLAQALNNSPSPKARESLRATGRAPRLRGACPLARTGSESAGSLGQEFGVVITSSRLATGQFENPHNSQVVSAQSLISAVTPVCEKVTNIAYFPANPRCQKMGKNLMRIAQ